jgi:hypothetical protein
MTWTRSVALAVAWCALAGAPAAAQPRIAVSQAVFGGHKIAAYLRITDGPTTIPDVQAGAVSAIVDTRPVKIESLVPFETTNEGVLYIVLVDNSGSLAEGFTLLRNALNQLAGSLGPNDKIAVYAFGNESTLKQEPTHDAEALKTVFGLMGPTDNKTKLYLALHDAIDFARTQNASLPRRRAIVIMSDGEDEGSGFTLDDVRRQLEQSRVPIFATGYRRSPSTSRRGLDALQNLSVISGGEFEEALPAQVQTVHERIQAAVRHVYVATLNCDGCPTDGQRHRLAVSFSASGNTVSDDVAVAVPYEAAPAAPQPPPSSRMRWVLIAGAALLLVAAVAIPLAVRSSRRRRAEREAAAKNAATPETQLSGRAYVPVDPGAGRRTTSTTGPALKVVCTVVRGGAPGQQFRTEVGTSRPVIGGAGSGCDIRLEQDREVADRHFELRTDGRLLFVSNLAGAMGTRRNGVPIVESSRIEDGDMLGAGSTDMRVRIGRE